MAIVIFSGKQFSGKDTLAKIMLEKMPNFKRCAMGDIIKKTYGEQHGLTYEQIEANKAKYRPDLIALGNWGRAQDKDYWLKKIVSQDGDIFVTDVRMLHEYEVFKSAGATSIRVEASYDARSARGQIVNANDPTETELDGVKDWDYIVENNSTLSNLTAKAEELVKKLTSSKG